MLTSTLLREAHTSQDPERLQEIFYEVGDDFQVREILAKNLYTPALVLRFLSCSSATIRFEVAKNPSISPDLLLTLIHVPTALENPSIPLFILEDPTFFHRLVDALPFNAGIHGKILPPRFSSLFDVILPGSLHRTFHLLRKEAANHKDDWFLTRMPYQIKLWYYQGQEYLMQPSFFRNGSTHHGNLYQVKEALDLFRSVLQDTRVARFYYQNEDFEGPLLDTWKDLLWYSDLQAKDHHFRF